jgi:hypothetical protein
MLLSFQEKNNAEVIGNIEKLYGGTFISEECFPGIVAVHKFKKGDKVELFGLEHYPQFNGEIVTITTIRQDGEYGRAYYFQTDNKELSEQLNWTYEYRLREVI